MKLEKIINANVLDVYNGTVQLSTVLIKDGLIYKVAEQEEIDSSGADLDLQGKYLSPGFIDTHSHLVMYSNFRRQLNCSPESISSIDDMIQKFINQKDNLLRDGWLRGYGYNEFELGMSTEY